MRAARILVWAVLGQLVLLTATGIYLYFEYRPESSDVALFSRPDTRVRIERFVRVVHRVDAWLVVVTLLALVIVVVVERVGRRRDRASTWAILTVCIVAFFTGRLLPWDQLALWSVTVGTNISGYSPIVRGQIRFALIDRAEIERATLVRWLVIHVILGLTALAGALWLRSSAPSAKGSETLDAAADANHAAG